MAWGSGRHQLGVASELPALSRERPSLMADPCDSWRFRGGSGVKSPSANAGDKETRVQSLSWGDPLK